MISPRYWWPAPADARRYFTPAELERPHRYSPTLVASGTWLVAAAAVAASGHELAAVAVTGIGLGAWAVVARSVVAGLVSGEVAPPTSSAAGEPSDDLPIDLLERVDAAAERLGTNPVAIQTIEDEPPTASGSTLFLPRWLSDQPDHSQDWIISHELAHIAMRDPRAQLQAVLGAVALPPAAAVVASSFGLIRSLGVLNLVCGLMFGVGWLLAAWRSRAAERRADAAATAAVGPLTVPEAKRLLWRPGAAVRPGLVERLLDGHPPVSERIAANTG